MSARAIGALAWRDSRTARRRLLLFMSSISIGVAALVAIDGYSANVVRSVREQSRALLGGDLSLGSREAFPPVMDTVLDSLARAGIGVGRTASFASMAVIPRTGGTRLVQVRATSPEVPFYGTIETEPAGRWPLLQRGRNALVDQSLLTELDAHVGDSLALGDARFAIIGVLRNVPGDVGIASALGPRVYIPLRDVAATGLLRFGSRAEYEALLRLPGSASPSGVAATLRNRVAPARIRARTVQDTERNLTEGVQQLDRFLGVVGLVALLLGGIGVASAIHAYLEEKTDTVAVLRCLGATARQVLAIYLLEAGALGLVGAIAGAALGVALQYAMPHVLGDFIPVTVAPRAEPAAIFSGLAVGLWVAVLFALLPLLRVRRISPLQALRRDALASPARRLLLDAPRLAASLALAASVVAIAIARAGSTVRGLAMSLGIGVALLLLWGSALLVSRAARRLVREHWPFVVRQGVANLYRPANQTRAVILALGFGAFLLGTLYLVQRNLLDHLIPGGARGDVQANLAFFDVQQDQAAGVDSIIRATGHPVLQRVPIVPMRIASINGQPVAALMKAHPSWAMRREYRSSWRDTLIASERVTAGRWLSAAHAAGELPEISVEKDVAGELGLQLGDTVTWDVQGVRIPTRVTSLREVTWARFEPNFFVVFSPDALRGAPYTEVLLTRVDDDAARAALQRGVVRRYSNVSSIDLSLIERAVQGILDKVSLAIRFMALFSVATGVLVLLSAVAASRRQRLREGVLLRTLGATRAQIARILLSEYAALGALGSAAGVLLSIAGAWALTRFVFETPFTLAVPALAVIAIGMMALTAAVGFWSSREVYRGTAAGALSA
ncbi:MAG TPA: FtsX-like permease family protein [Gemmatimonadaceae bacterium]